MRDYPNTLGQSSSPSSTLNSTALSVPKPPTPTSSPVLRRSRSSSASSDLNLVRQSVDMDSSDSDVESRRNKEEDYPHQLQHGGGGGAVSATGGIAGSPSRRHTLEDADAPTTSAVLRQDDDIRSGPVQILGGQPTVTDNRGERSQSRIIRRTASLREPIIEKFGTFFSTLKQNAHRSENRSKNSSSEKAGLIARRTQPNSLVTDEKIQSLKKQAEGSYEEPLTTTTNAERNGRKPGSSTVSKIEDEDILFLEDSAIPFAAYSISSNINGGSVSSFQNSERDSAPTKSTTLIPRSGVFVPDSTYSPSIGPRNKTVQDETFAEQQQQQQKLHELPVSTELLPTRESPPFDKERKGSIPCLGSGKKTSSGGGGTELVTRSHFVRNRPGSFKGIVLPDKTNLRKQKANSSECLVMPATGSGSDGLSAHPPRIRGGSQENVDVLTYTPRPPLVKKPTTDSENENSDPEAVSRGVLPPRPHSTIRKLPAGIKASSPLSIPSTSSATNNCFFRLRDNSPSKASDGEGPSHRAHEDTDEFDSLLEDNNQSDEDCSPKCRAEEGQEATTTAATGRRTVPLIMTPAARIARNSPAGSSSPPKNVTFNPHLDVVNIESQAGERERAYRTRRHGSRPNHHGVKRDGMKENAPQDGASSKHLSEEISPEKQSKLRSPISPFTQVTQHEIFLEQSSASLREQMNLLEEIRKKQISERAYRQKLIKILHLQEEKLKKLVNIFRYPDE